MAKKSKDDNQPQAVVEVGSESRTQEASEQKSPKSGIVTTEGNTIDKIRIFQMNGATMVQADYGKLNLNAKSVAERRAGMRTQISRALTPEQSREYQRLHAESPFKAKEYAVRTAYPMHVDDAAFHQKDTSVNGRKVDYIVLEKLDASNLSDNNKHLAGSWQLSFGEKGKPETRVFGILNKEELASIRHRAEVSLAPEPVTDQNGNVIHNDKGDVVTRDVVKSIGAPLSMADIAARFETRITAQREAQTAKLAAQKVDWSRYKFQDGIKVADLHYAPSKDPSHVWLNGNVNGIRVFSLLSQNETTAVLNKFATLEQAAAANKMFREKVYSIVAPAQSQVVDQAAAVNAIVARASDSAARSFTPAQVKTLNDYASASGAQEPDARAHVFDALWKAAEPSLKSANVPEAWQKDAHEELKDLADGVARSEQQGMHR